MTAIARSSGQRRALREVVLATVALGLLLGVVFRGGGPVTGSSDHLDRVVRTIDFNRPETLARSIERVGPASEALHHVRCSPRGGGAFVCTGVGADGVETTMHVVVANGGASWTSR